MMKNNYIYIYKLKLNRPKLDAARINPTHNELNDRQIKLARTVGRVGFKVKLSYPTRSRTLIY